MTSAKGGERRGGWVGEVAAAREKGTMREAGREKARGQAMVGSGGRMHIKGKMASAFRKRMAVD